jgi:hypothetical protein
MGAGDVLDPGKPGRVGVGKVGLSRGERNGRGASGRFYQPDEYRDLAPDDFWPA